MITSFVNSSAFFLRNTLPVFSITSRNVRGNSSTLHARNNDAAHTLYKKQIIIKYIQEIIYLTSKSVKGINHVKTMHINNSCIDTIMWSKKTKNFFLKRNV
jgi:hypothetical protein